MWLIWVVHFYSKMVINLRVLINLQVVLALPMRVQSSWCYYSTLGYFECTSLVRRTGILHKVQQLGFAVASLLSRYHYWHTWVVSNTGYVVYSIYGFAHTHFHCYIQVQPFYMVLVGGQRSRAKPNIQTELKRGVASIALYPDTLTFDIARRRLAWAYNFFEPLSDEGVRGHFN